ncbi:helix-turn-helix domain-containing protein [uncultured Actinomyces sp.]|uniref:helix-turn-helix domain-containing protein n=1 Tax=uncultured Actinomyces sp. TaxID=249061 RepID=UPI0028DC1415|nr:helix-turn-helix domain-containing protein [uncultured Actinomyces sp.]
MTESQAQQAPQPAWASLVARAGLSPARRRVLRAVQESASPVSAAELAQDLGLHHNTVREHLESLVKQGMVSMTPVSTGRRGRPTLRYQVTAPDPVEVLVSYTTLLDAVARTLGEGEEARQVALTIGRRWAAESATQPGVTADPGGTAQPGAAEQSGTAAGPADAAAAPGADAAAPGNAGAPAPGPDDTEQPSDAAAPGDAEQSDTAAGPADAEDLPEPLASLMPGLMSMGFTPHVDDGTGDVVLTTCPLVARDRRPHPLVCAMHEGYLHAAAEESRREAGDDQDGAGDRLTLTVMEADGCHVRLEPGTDSRKEAA